MLQAETIEIPGLVDLHTHLRQSSTNNAETIASGTRAAVLGGYVMIADMPNNPGNPTWSEEAMLEKHSIANTSAYIPVSFYAGSQPESDNLSDLVKMSYMAIGMKLYGAPTTGNHNDYEAHEFSDAVSVWHEASPKKPIMFHAGHDNLGDMINMVGDGFKHPIHICHVNNGEQIDIVQDAKADGIQVTCGVCPHHLLKTSHDVQSEGWFARMQPPLAEQPDAEELMYRLKIGDIDVIETDHAPHSLTSKWNAETLNPEGIHDEHHATCFGVPGIEFALPLMLYQVKRDNLSLERLIETMSTNPARILGVELPSISTVTVEMSEYRINEESSYAISGSAWTPFLGKLAVGKVQSVQIGSHRLVSGNEVVDSLPRVVLNRSAEYFGVSK